MIVVRIIASFDTAVFNCFDFELDVISQLADDVVSCRHGCKEYDLSDEALGPKPHLHSTTDNHGATAVEEVQDDYPVTYCLKHADPLVCIAFVPDAVIHPLYLAVVIIVPLVPAHVSFNRVHLV